MPSSQVDLRDLINMMADEFERLHGVIIPVDAREILIAPALEHQEDVYAELASGEITLETIRDKVMEQLGIASDVALDRVPDGLRESARRKKRIISANDTKQSMNIRCALMFWC